MRYKNTNEELKEAVKNNLSLAGVLRALNIRAVGGNYKTIKKRIEDLGLDTSHFTGKGWNVGIKYRKIRKNTPLKEILIENSSYVSTNSLKKRLLNEKVKEYKCEICGNTEWMGKPIPLELHHINGNNTDNRIENLQILCPNCHATTDTYRGKNLQSALSERREVEYRKFREALTGNADGNPEPSLTNNSKEGAETLHDKSKSKKPKIIRYCECCGKELTNRQMKYCSVKCYIESTKGRRPDIFTLLNDFKELHSVLQVSKKYGVSDNAVRPWCEFYGILDMIKRKSRPQTE